MRQIARARGRTPSRKKWVNKLILVVFAAVLIMAVWLYRQYESRQWSGRERLTVIELGPEVKVVSFDPENGTGVKLTLPQNLEIQTTQGRGRWRVGVMDELARKYGRKWALDSISDNFGIVYTIDENSLNVWDKWNRFRAGKNVVWTEADLINENLVSESLAADGQKILSLNKDWDNQARDWFASAVFLKSGVGVNVINTTEVDGLGGHAARTIENNGLRVLSVKTYTEGPVNKCQVMSGSGLKPKLVAEFLKRAFDCDLRMGRVDADEVNLYLGQEYRDWWLGKQFS